MEAYKITKTIRFKLKVDKNSEIQNDMSNLKETQQSFNLVDFVSDLSNFINGTYKYLFYKKKDGDLAIKNKIVIQNEWLRTYVKQEFIDFRAKGNNNYKQQITIGDINGLFFKIKTIFRDVCEIYMELASDSGKKLSERAKREKEGLLLKRLQTKNTLLPLMSLIERTIDKDEIDCASIELKRQIPKLNAKLLAGIKAYLPAQSNGVVVAKASFNYYTVNKKPIDFKGEIVKLEEKLKIDIKNIQLFNLCVDKHKNEETCIPENILNAIIADIEKELIKYPTLLLGDAPMLDIENYTSLRQILKNIKSKQKKVFSEFMQEKNIQYRDLKNKKDLYLFNAVLASEFDEYLQKTKAIDEKAMQIKQCTDDKKKILRSKLQELKKQRGSLINAADKNTKNKFKIYKSFAKLYRFISQKHGKILAQLKGIKKEQTESQLLKYWAVILENKNRHKLVLIPREKAGKCKNYLEHQSNTNDDTRIFWFESFTYRSLQKLCFDYVENGRNSFNKKLSQEISIPRGEFEFKGNKEKKIEFYKTVLCSEYAKQVLSIPWKQVEEEIINKQFDSNLEYFQIALEKICYTKKVICESTIAQKLKEEYDAQIFDITSLDLEKRDKTNIKNHTQIWKDFWSAKNEQSNFDIRLNPEITISYREPKPSRINKYGELSKYYDANKHNRYLHPQFILSTTINEHSNASTKMLSFITDDELKSTIDEFKGKIKQEDIKFAFGIDNGEAELSTLGIYLPDFDKNTNEEKIAELQQVEKYGFEVLTIRNLRYKETDYNGKERKIIQNPSYFLKKETYMHTFNKTEYEYNKMFNEVFEKKRLLTLDLTTAKVICGNIVTNGDIPALLELWLRHAQRNIFDMNDHIKEKTAKNVILKNTTELTNKEKVKFVEYISHIKKYEKLSDEEKRKYLRWIFENRDGIEVSKEEEEKFKKIQKNKGNFSTNIIFAVCNINEDNILDVRNIFKKRKEFDFIKEENEIKNEIYSYNKGNVSNEELDLKINHRKQSIVANAIGIIDFLYKQYKERFNGEGLIVKEGFDINKVIESLEKFSGNIYRILERKLYQKFQNYGLVPPIKNLMMVRGDGVKNDKNAILQLGNIAFVNEADTSQECPVCIMGKLNHGVKCSCGFNAEGIMHSNDGIAGFNIAKRGFENFKNFKKQK